MTWGLFQFRRINRYFWRQLEYSEFFFSRPERLNDPFDCRVDWRRSLSRALATSTISSERRSKLVEIQSAFLGRDPHLEAGVCCFTINMNNHLMWSHYADSHRGICLFYSIPEDFFPRSYPPGHSRYFVGGSPVFYGNEALFNWLTTEDLDQPLPGDHIENAVSRIFSSKAEAWKHEEEFRLIASKEGSLKIDPAFLKQVTFGLRTPHDVRDRVRKLVKSTNPNAFVSEVRKDPQSDFGLMFPDVEA